MRTFVCVFYISHCIIVELSPTPQYCLCFYSYLNDSIVCELKIIYFFLQSWRDGKGHMWVNMNCQRYRQGGDTFITLFHYKIINFSCTTSIFPSFCTYIQTLYQHIAARRKNFLDIRRWVILIRSPRAMKFIFVLFFCERASKSVSKASKTWKKILLISLCVCIWPSLSGAKLYKRKKL